tara:strand:+ start:1242 stop:1640 length:399 start_codon:yes stop_codon:yes gene_type:complete
MPRFEYSKTSLRRLDTCDPRLVAIFMKVADHVDTTIICGHRNEADQNEAFRTGHSRVKFPNGKHNTAPCLAVDAAPYPIDWNDSRRFYLFGGFVLGVAANMGHILRYGGDWDSDFNVNDQNFNDLVHFELKD